jgi:hypothetical protein
MPNPKEASCNVHGYGKYINKNKQNKEQSKANQSSITLEKKLGLAKSSKKLMSSAHGARVCRVSYKHLPQPLRSHILNFGILGQLFKIPPFSPKKSYSAGVGGVPDFFWGWNPNIFVT